VQTLKQVVTTLRMTAIFESVYVSAVNTRFAEDGDFRPDEVLDVAAVRTLNRAGPCRSGTQASPHGLIRFNIDMNNDDHHI